MPALTVKIPGSSKLDTKRNLEDCIHYAADKTGKEALDVALIATYLFEAIADKLSLNEFVLVPGFGMFCNYFRRGTPYGCERRVVAHFVAASNLNAYIYHSVPEATARGTKNRVSQYVTRSNVSNHQRSGKKVKRNSESIPPAVALEHVRESLLRNAPQKKHRVSV